jgi:hypothetical protein
MFIYCLFKLLIETYLFFLELHLSKVVTRHTHLTLLPTCTHKGYVYVQRQRIKNSHKTGSSRALYPLSQVSWTAVMPCPQKCLPKARSALQCCQPDLGFILRKRVSKKIKASSDLGTNGLHCLYQDITTEVSSPSLSRLE